MLILLYTTEKRAYLGFIPNDQVAFVDRLRKVIQQQKNIQMPRPVSDTLQIFEQTCYDMYIIFVECRSKFESTSRW